MLSSCAETLAGAAEQKEVLVAEPAVQQEVSTGAEAERIEPIVQKVQLCDFPRHPYRA